jgi:hypothetical protein
MTKFKKILTGAALAVTVMGGMAAVTATPASARVVCDRWHCWHTRGYYDPYYDSDYYGPGYYGPGVTFGFGFGGGRGHGGGHFHGGGFHGGGSHSGGHHH